jgi:hypothetical protein
MTNKQLILLESTITTLRLQLLAINCVPFLSLAEAECIAKWAIHFIRRKYEIFGSQEDNPREKWLILIVPCS